MSTYMSREKKRMAERESAIYADFCEFAKQWLLPDGCLQQHILIVYFRDNFPREKYKYSEAGSDDEIVHAITKWNNSDVGHKAEINDFGLYIGFQLNMEKEKQKREEDELNKRREEIKLTLAESKKYGVKPPLDVLKEACELGIIPVPEATLKSMEEVRQKRASMAAPSSSRNANSRRASTSALSNGHVSSSSHRRKTRAQSTFQPKLPAAVALALKRKQELEDNYRPYEQAKAGKTYNPFEEEGAPREEDEDQDSGSDDDDEDDRDRHHHHHRSSSSHHRRSSSSHRRKSLGAGSSHDDRHHSSSRSPRSSSSSKRMGKSMSGLDAFTRDSSPHRKSDRKKDKERKSSSSHHRSSSSRLGKSMSAVDPSSSRHRDRDEKDRKRDKKEKDRKSSSRRSSSDMGKSMSALESSRHRSDRDKDKDKDRKSEKRDKERKSSSSDRRSSRMSKSISDLDERKSSRRDKDKEKERKRDKEKKSSRRESSRDKDKKISSSSSRPAPRGGGLVKQLSKTFLG